MSLDHWLRPDRFTRNRLETALRRIQDKHQLLEQQLEDWARSNPEEAESAELESTEDLKEEYLRQEAEGYAAEIVDDAFLLFQLEPRPWSTVTREDLLDWIAEYLRQWLKEEVSLRFEPLLTHLNKSIRDSTSQFCVSCLLHCPDEALFETLYRFFAPPAWKQWSILEEFDNLFGVQRICGDYQDGPIQVKILSQITERARTAHAECVSEVLQQCATLAGGRLASQRMRPRLAFMRRLHQGRFERGDPHLDCDGRPPSMRAEEHYDLYLDADAADADSLKRFNALVRLVFRGPPQRADTDNGALSPEDIVNLAVWRMASLPGLDADPVAFVGYISVFETAGLKYVATRVKHSDSVGAVLGEKLRLPPNCRRRLDGLFQKRNAAVHDLAFGVKNEDVAMVFGLALAAVFALLAKVTRTKVVDSGGPREYDLASEVARILRLEEQ